ncbi:MAG: Dabb family protein [Pyrinomonadaceae bacterium]
MLVQVVLWKYKSEVSDEERDDHVFRLRRLSEEIPYIASYHVGQDIRHDDRPFDTGLTSTFADRENLKLYLEHEAYRKVEALGQRIADMVVSVDVYI